MMILSRSDKKYEVGAVIWRDGREYVVTGCWPILSRYKKKGQDTSIEAWQLTLVSRLTVR